MAGGTKKYPDLRYLFIRGLISLERFQRTRHFLKSAAEWTSRAIVSLDCSENSIKSVHQAEKLEGIGAEIKKKLQTIYVEQRYSSDPPRKGIYCSSGAAILVALLELTEKETNQGHSQDRSVLIEEATLKSKAQKLSEEKFTCENEENGFCKAWWRIEVLIKRDLVKRRTLNKLPVYHLLPLGTETAHRLRGTVPSSIVAMPTDPHPTRDRPETVAVQVDAPWVISPHRRKTPDDALYTNDNGDEGITLLIDTQELGGDRQGLGELCQLLEQACARYQTRHLECGDYRWIWRCDGVERFLPCLVERKRADDMAKSLKDGRFWKQVQKMVEWKKKFEVNGIGCQLYYIVEGEPEQYMVQCADGCQGVGKCGYPNVTQVKCALRDLKSHPDLTVETTDNIESTVILLASVTDELQRRVNKGEFDEMIVKELSGNIVSVHDNTTVLVDDENDAPDGTAKGQTDDTGSDVEIQVGGSFDMDKRQTSSRSKKGKKTSNTPAKALKRGHSSNYDDSPSTDVKMNDLMKTREKHVSVIEDENEEFLPLEPLTQYHCAAGSNVRYPGQQNTSSSQIAYRPKVRRSDESSTSPFAISKVTLKKDVSLCDSQLVNRSNVKFNSSSFTDTSFASDDDSQERRPFRAKKLKLNLNPDQSYTEPVKDYTPPGQRGKGKVYLMKSIKQKSAVCGKSKETEKDFNDSNVCNTSSQRFEASGSEFENLELSKEIRERVAALRSELEGTGRSTESEQRFETLDSDLKTKVENKPYTEGVFLQDDLRKEKCTNKVIDTLHSEHLSERCGKFKCKDLDSDEESLPDLHIPCSIKDKKSDSFGYSKNTNLLTENLYDQDSLLKEELPFEKGGSKHKGRSYKQHREKSPSLDYENASVSNVKIPYTRADKEQNEQISVIRSVLPHITRIKALEVLRKHKGNIELSMAELLDNGSPDNSPIVDLTESSQ